MKVHLRKTSFLFLALMLALSAVLILNAMKVPMQFQLFAKNSMQAQKVAQAAVKLQEASDYLTDESRRFVITGEWSHLENYFVEVNETKRREKALEEIRNAGAAEESARFLEMALKESKALEELECKAMKLVVIAKGYDKNSSYNVPPSVEKAELSREEIAMDFNTKMAAAWLILFSEQYFSMKKAISDYRTSAVAEIFKHTTHLNRKNAESLKSTFNKTLIGIIMIVIISLAFFLIIIFFVVNSLYAFIESIKKQSGYVVKLDGSIKKVYALEGTFLRDKTISKGRFCTYYDLYITSENENDLIVIDEDIKEGTDFFQMEEK